MGNFVPKYKPQAESFSGMIDKYNAELSSNVEELDSLSGKINISSDTEDALAFHVISMTKKASEDLEDKIENNISLAGDISSAAKRFDDEDYEEFLEEERKAQERQNAANKASSVETEETDETEETKDTEDKDDAKDTKTLGKPLNNSNKPVAILQR